MKSTSTTRTVIFTAAAVLFVVNAVASPIVPKLLPPTKPSQAFASPIVPKPLPPTKPSQAFA